MANRNYIAAHQYFATEATKSDHLSARQRRLVMDGLCTTEYEIGAPTYPLARQLSTCESAVSLAGSESGQTFSRVAPKQHEALAPEID
jgi:hypothetical protein